MNGWFRHESETMLEVTPNGLICMNHFTLDVDIDSITRSDAVALY